MATLAAGGTSTATLSLDAFASVAVVCDASCNGTLTFTSAAPNLLSNKTFKVQNKTYGPFGVPGTLSFTVTAGSLTYTPAWDVGGFNYDTSGNITGLASSNGSVIPFSTVQDATFRLGTPIAVSIDSNSGVSVSGTGASSAYVTLNNFNGIQVTTGAGSFAEVSLPTISNTIASGKMVWLVYVSDCTKVSSITPYVGDSGYANFFNASLTISTNPPFERNGYQLITPYFNPSVADSARYSWAVGGGAPVFGTTTFTDSKLRITPTASNQAVVTVLGCWIGGVVDKPRIVVTLDDGWATQYTNALPILSKYNIKGSFGIIRNAIGSNGNYMTLANLQTLVAMGHEMVVHGPDSISGDLSQYSTTAQAQADMSNNQSYLTQNGLATNGSEKIYVWPAGVYAPSAGSQTYLTAASNLGFVAARCASGPAVAFQHNNFTSSTAMFLPRIGHTWTSAPTETANIAAIIARIQDAVTQGRDCVLMFHKITTGAAADSLEIQQSNFASIMSAINVLETAGTAKTCTMTELARVMLQRNTL